MRPSLGIFAVVGLSAVPLFGSTVTIEQVMRSTSSGTSAPGTSTPGVPGRPANFVFRAENPIPPPSINDTGDLVFRARSASNANANTGQEFGIYAKRVGFPLSVLVDTTDSVSGVPTFAVPGRPANNRFTSFRSPILNNAGDVVFQAGFSSPGTTPSSGTGVFTVKITGGPIVKIADTFTAVPGFPTGTFNTFDPGLLSVALTTVVNDNGEIAYWGQFLITGNATQRTGLFGSTVLGGAGVRLADSVGASGPISVPVGVNGFFNEIRYAVAINNPGTVVFSAGMPGGATNRGGVYVVPVTGGNIETVAIRGQPVPGRVGQTFQDTFEPGGHNVDINDSGVILFRNQYLLSLPFDFGAYSAVASGGGFTHTRIFDTGSGLTIPGEPASSEYSGFVLPSINDSNVISPWSRVSPSPTPNQQGFFYTDEDGTPNTLIANLNTAPPGQPAPVGGFPRFTGFEQTNGALGALNELGNLTFLGVGNPTSSTSFRGIYFYDVCTPELFRISDSTISSVQLAGAVNNGYDIWQVEAHAGMYRSINNLNDVAFAVLFSNFDYGIYIAHISTSGGGAVAIACPADVTAECPADGGVASGGTATASGCGTITVSSSDVLIGGCGGTESISRTWTATNGSTSAICVQTLSEVDVTPPVLSGAPNDAAVQCNALPPAATVTAMDACEGSVPVTLTETQVAGSCPGTYVLTRTWTATDSCGNSSSASQDVAVMDTLDPLLMGVPTDVTVECDAVPAPATVTASDTCSTSVPVTFAETQTNGSCADEYTLTRSWTAVDECLNDVTALQIVTVDDTTAPTISCPAHTTLECPADSGVAANGSASATDNCAAAVISSADATLFGCGATYTVTRSWTAADNCGNASSCDQFVAVVDTTAPVLAGVPADASAECDAVPAAATVTASDGCDADVSVTASETRADGACASSYTLSRSWSAADDCGNSASASQSLTVADTTPPTISCPSNVTVECPASAGATGTATASDNCGGTTVSSSDATTAGCGNTGTTVRTWSAGDDCGLTSTCQQTISTVDTTPPSISVNTDAITVTDTDCSETVCIPLPVGTATDSCDTDVAVQHDAPICGPGNVPIPDPGDDDCGYHCRYHHDDCDNHDDDDDPPSGTCGGFCFPTGTTTVTYTAMDDCGNTSTASKTVTVLHGANIAVRLERHTVYQGHHPETNKEPIEGIEVCAYDKSWDGCARNQCGGIGHPYYQCILDNCESDGCCVTGANGRCTINIDPGDYLVLASDPTEEVLPDPIGAIVSDLDCGETRTAHLKQIVDIRGKKRPCKVWRFTGSELLVIEPEFIVWDEEVQYYPFVLESEGDWDVTATVAPPDGFVTDYPELSAEVANEVGAVQFTITEVGSDLIPTQTEFSIQHQGRLQTFRSSIDIRLTPGYAELRGFRLDRLRADGLITEPAELRRAQKGTMRSERR